MIIVVTEIRAEIVVWHGRRGRLGDKTVYHLYSTSSKKLTNKFLAWFLNRGTRCHSILTGMVA